jgi:hypothetical protein
MSTAANLVDLATGVYGALPRITARRQARGSAER